MTDRPDGPPPSLPNLQAGALFAGFRIESVLDRGGMGVVYRAADLDLDRIVALKIIAPEHARDPTAVARFKAEARLAASLEHPNIVPVHRGGEHDGVLYIAMRLVPGTNLRRVIEGGPMELRRASRIVSQVADALDVAHERGLVHRDVKPANILLTGPVGQEHVYLTDFGLTKRLGSSGDLTRTGGWVGTPDYVAPEQLQGHAIDGRADVYSLGCVVYEMLTGQVVYPRDSHVAKLWAHVSDPPAMPRRTRPELVPAFDELIARATAKDPDARYGTVRELAAALADAIAQQEATQRDVATQTTAPPLRPPLPAQASAGGWLERPVIGKPAGADDDTVISEPAGAPEETISSEPAGPRDEPVVSEPAGAPEGTLSSEPAGPHDETVSSEAISPTRPPHQPATPQPAATAAGAQDETVASQPAVSPARDPHQTAGSEPAPSTGPRKETVGSEPGPAAAAPATSVPAAPPLAAGAGSGSEAGGTPRSRRRWLLLAAPALLAALVVVVALLLSGSDSKSPQPTAPASVTVPAELAPVPLNRVHGFGDVRVRLSGDVANVTVTTEGLLDRAPHLMHIHGLGRGQCPPGSAARSHNGHLTIATHDGAPFYGGVLTALTTRGDTTKKSFLAFSRAPRQGAIRYSRRIRLDPVVARVIRQGGNAVVVIHGIDYNESSGYDFGSLDRSDLNRSVPAEQTAPALCGALQPPSPRGPGRASASTQVFTAALRPPPGEPTPPLLCSLPGAPGKLT